MPVKMKIDQYFDKVMTKKFVAIISTHSIKLNIYYSKRHCNLMDIKNKIGKVIASEAG